MKNFTLRCNKFDLHIYSLWYHKAKTECTVFKKAFIPICLLVAVSICSADTGLSLQYADLPDTKTAKDISYGTDRRQRFDVYFPQKITKDTKTILMVHGGAWSVGDKSSKNVVQNKAAYLTKKGYIFASTNYRLFPKADPLTQKEDIEAAFEAVVHYIDKLGADKQKVILMGHSAGAHLVVLLNASKKGGWAATVALDSAAYDFVELMGTAHLGFYDKIFGQKDETYLKEVSPKYKIQDKTPPMLLVCSTLRADGSCKMTEEFAKEALKYKNDVKILKVRKTHAQINDELGVDMEYTNEIAAFLEGI